MVAGTLTVSSVGEVGRFGVSGPSLTGPLEVATKKLSTDPGVNPLPLTVKLPPTSTTGGMLLMIGVPGTTVGVAVGVLGVEIGVGDGVRVGVGVLAGVRVGEGAQTKSALPDELWQVAGVGVGVGFAVGVEVGVDDAGSTHGVVLPHRSISPAEMSPFTSSDVRSTVPVMVMVLSASIEPTPLTEPWTVRLPWTQRSAVFKVRSPSIVRSPFEQLNPVRVSPFEVPGGISPMVTPATLQSHAESELGPPARPGTRTT